MLCDSLPEVNGESAGTVKLIRIVNTHCSLSSSKGYFAYEKLARGKSIGKPARKVAGYSGKVPYSHTLP